PWDVRVVDDPITPWGLVEHAPTRSQASTSGEHEGQHVGRELAADVTLERVDFGHRNMKPTVVDGLAVQRIQLCQHSAQLVISRDLVLAERGGGLGSRARVACLVQQVELEARRHVARVDTRWQCIEGMSGDGDSSRPDWGQLELTLLVALD